MLCVSHQFWENCIEVSSRGCALRSTTSGTSLSQIIVYIQWRKSIHNEVPDTRIYTPPDLSYVERSTVHIRLFPDEESLRITLCIETRLLKEDKMDIIFQ